MSSPAVAPRISVAICTWNRSALLRQVLEDLTRLDIPPFVPWELLVVNNNCTDDTAHVLAAFADRLPLRQVVERTQGLSHARNAAVAHCRGEYILWTDDDVRVDRGWLAAYLRAFEAHPGASVFGGRIQPRFERAAPEWLTRIWPRVATAYGERDLGAHPLRFDGEKLTPFGANYAVRASDQRRHPYDTRLGRRPGSMVSGEETALVQALLAEGKEGWWVPDACVEHHVPARLLTTRYLRRYFAGLGATMALVEPTVSRTRSLRERWRELRLAIDRELDYRKARRQRPPEEWINALIVSSMTWGRLTRR
ncbi:MAG TPA: glycosyltransferase [Gemmatimonadaceae bacterium]|nr:glycosyltransferase [Gemmatimonadaceae bacterium]